MNPTSDYLHGLYRAFTGDIYQGTDPWLPHNPQNQW